MHPCRLFTLLLLTQLCSASLAQSGSLHLDTEADRLKLDTNRAKQEFVTISNARGFINGSEIANVRAMCAAWDESAASGDARITQALASYKAREQLTQTFIAKYYGAVLFEVEAFLDEKSLTLFRTYMNDRRRRLANAGMTSWGSPVQNIRAGTGTIDFHCRTH